MKCEEALKHLSEYVDRSLDPEARKELEAHLATCPDCACALEEVKRMVQMYRSCKAEALPADVCARLYGTLEAGAKPASRSKTGAHGSKR
jgi:anti-sigma factor (TIGR02949 family)